MTKLLARTRTRRSARATPADLEAGGPRQATGDAPAAGRGPVRGRAILAGETAGSEQQPTLSDEALEVSRLVVDLVHAALSSGGPSYGRRPAETSGGPETSSTTDLSGPAPAATPTGAGSPTAVASPPIHGGAPTHLSAHAVRASVAIYQHGQCTVSELAATLGVSLGWASRIAEELESRGYVVRQRSSSDRRVVQLRLSDRAIEEVNRAYRWRGDAIALAIEGLDAHERAAVRIFLRRLADAFLAGSGR